MSLASDFKGFALKGNVIDLAVAVVIGAAFSKIVTAVVEGLIMPLVGLVLPGGDWRQYEAPLGLKVGQVLGATIDFLVVAFVLFLVVRKLMRLGEQPAPVPAPTRTCPDCLESIPAAARKCRACGSTLAAAALLLALWPAGVRGAELEDVLDPTFQFGKPETVEKAWTAQVKGGLTQNTGNSRSTTLAVSASAARRMSDNRLALDGRVAYTRASVLEAPDLDGNGFTDRGELRRRTETIANLWDARARYDRFFAATSSGYLIALVGADRTAGKELFAGGQIGYSRHLYQTDSNDFVAEVGYDYSHETYLPPVSTGYSIHSARLFLGEAVKLGPQTSVSVSVEALSNVNTEDAPNASEAGSNEVGAFRDTRVVGKAGVVAMLTSKVALDVSFSLRFDNNPPPQPLPGGARPYAPGFLPFSEKTDTVTLVQLVVNLI